MTGSGLKKFRVRTPLGGSAEIYFSLRGQQGTVH